MGSDAKGEGQQKMNKDNLKSYWATFGVGTILNGYTQEFRALDEDIVRAYMNRHYSGLWSRIFTAVPEGFTRLQRLPVNLFYVDARHV